MGECYVREELLTIGPVFFGVRSINNLFARTFDRQSIIPSLHPNNGKDGSNSQRWRLVEMRTRYVSRSNKWSVHVTHFERMVQII